MIPSPRIRDLSLAPDNYVSHGATRELMLIVALAGILLGSLGWVLQSSPDALDTPEAGTQPPVRSEVATSRTQPAIIADAGSVQRSDATTALARPLFSRGRRPPSTPVSVTASEPDNSLPRLTGVIIGPRERHAIFDFGDGKSRTMTTGDQLREYVIRTIQTGVVVLDGTDHELELHTTFLKPSATGGTTR